MLTARGCDTNLAGKPLKYGWINERPVNTDGTQALFPVLETKGPKSKKVSGGPTNTEMTR